MNEVTKGRIAALFRYPIKGLSADPMETVNLEAGEAFPGDRAFALENGPSGFDDDAPAHQSKSAFFMLMSHPALAQYRSRYDPDSGQLKIYREKDLLLASDLESRAGRKTVEAFFNAALAEEARGPVRLIHAPGISFSDMDAKLVHIINLESIRELDAAVERHVDPARFRANIHIDGIRAFAERSWVGKKLSVGTAELEVVDETGRCAAISVDPQSATRNMTLPADLERLYGNSKFGIYAKVTRGGSFDIGAPVELIES